MKRLISLFAIIILVSYNSFAQLRIVHDVYYGIFDDAEQRWIMPPKYNEIIPLTNYGPQGKSFYACQRNGKWAIASSLGEITSFAFDGIKGTHYGSLFVAKQDGKWGVVRVDELIVFPFEYQLISFNKNGDFTFSIPGQNAIKRSVAEMVSANKKAFEHVKFDNQLNEDIKKEISLPLVPRGAEKQEIKEVSSTKTIVVSDLSSLQLGDCSNGYFIFRDSKTNLTYIFDSNGNKTGEMKTLKVKASFDSTPVAIVMLEDYSCAIIRPDASIVAIVKGWSITPFVDGIALLQLDKLSPESRSIFINSAGEHVYKHISYSSEELTSNDFIEMTDLVRHIRENRRAYYKNGRYGFLDASGKIVIPAKYLTVHDFHEGLAAVATRIDNQILWGFIDINGEYVIEPKYSHMPSDFHEGFAVVIKRDGTYCYIDKTGTVRADGFTAASRFFHGYAIAGRNHTSKLNYVLNSEADIIANTYCRVENIRSYHSEYMAGNATLYSPAGKRLFQFDVTTGLHFNDGISICTNKRMKGYVNDKGEWVVVFKPSEF